MKLKGGIDRGVAKKKMGTGTRNVLLGKLWVGTRFVDKEGGEDLFGDFIQKKKKKKKSHTT